MYDLRDKIANPALVQQLDQELTRMARAQYDTPEFKLMFSTPLTLERARRHAILRHQSTGLLGLRSSALALRG